MDDNDLIFEIDEDLENANWLHPNLSKEPKQEDIKNVNHTEED
jgi:hypothetical protein